MRYKTRRERYECSSCGPFIVELPNPPKDADISRAIRKHLNRHTDSMRAGTKEGGE